MKTKQNKEIVHSGVVISVYLPRELAAKVSAYLEKNSGRNFSEHVQDYWKKTVEEKGAKNE